MSRHWILIILLMTNIKGFICQQKAPASVKIQLSVRELSQTFLNNESCVIRLCVDRQHENCYWTHNLVYEINSNLGKPLVYDFQINNMNTELQLGIKIEQRSLIVNFQRLPFNLKDISNSKTFELVSFNLETTIKVIISHKCVAGYHPPNQCTKFCYPLAGVQSCDQYGNMVCAPGLLFNADSGVCEKNICLTSRIVCRNNGHCRNYASSFVCECPRQFTGKYCERHNPCQSNPCGSQSSCVILDNTASSISYKCLTTTTTTITSVPPLTIPTNDKTVDISNTNQCNCPKGTKCIFSNNNNNDGNQKKQRQLISCVFIGRNSRDNLSTQSDSESNLIQPANKQIKSKNQSQETIWPLTMTTMIIVAIGLSLFVVCVCTTLCVFYQTRNYKQLRKLTTQTSSCAPLNTQYSSAHSSHMFSPTPSLINNSTFKRGSFFGDQNSLYTPVCCHSNNIGNPHHHHSATCNNPTIRSNSYQDNSSDCGQPNNLFNHSNRQSQQSLALLGSGSINNNGSHSPFLWKQPGSFGHNQQPQSPCYVARQMSVTSVTSSNDSAAPSLPPRPSQEVLMSLMPNINGNLDCTNANSTSNPLVQSTTFKNIKTSQNNINTTTLQE